MSGKQGQGAANHPFLHGPQASPSPGPKGKVASVSEMPKWVTYERALPVGDTGAGKPKAHQRDNWPAWRKLHVSQKPIFVSNILYMSLKHFSTCITVPSPHLFPEITQFSTWQL